MLIEFIRIGRLIFDRKFIRLANCGYFDYSSRFVRLRLSPNKLFLSR
jgi:hypothetical protein